MAGFPTNGLPIIGSTSAYYATVGNERLAADTYLASGASPQTLALTTFGVASLQAGMAANASTDVANAVTSNVLQGTITSASLSTAVGATYLITLTNSTVSATSIVRAAVFSKSNTTPGAYISSIVPAAGSVAITITNGGTAALNGTMVVPFLVSTL